MSDKNEQVKEPLWRWSALSEALCGVNSGVNSHGPDVQRVVADSRLVAPGDLFVALSGDPGARFNPSYRSAVDGHDFVTQAFSQGAVGALVSKFFDHNQNTQPLLQVDDTYDGLWALGTSARKRLRGDVIAVTGSSGKTTAKGFIQAALGAYAPPGSFNNHIGVPLSLANAPASSVTGVFEIGTSHPGEVEPLANMVKPDIAVLLNVHTAHIENFENYDSLREEKISIFNVLDDKSLAISDVQLKLTFGRTFGLHAAADAWVEALVGDMATINIAGQSYKAKVPGGGMHRAQTLAATLLVCQCLGRDLLAACELPDTSIPLGRGNVRQTGSVAVYDDSYNANPASMLASITNFSQGDAGGFNIAVIGEMLELGELAEPGHMALYDVLSALDQVYCVGEGTKALARRLGCHWCESADDKLCQSIVSHGASDTRILVKGSNRVFWVHGFVDRLMQHLE